MIGVLIVLGVLIVMLPVFWHVDVWASRKQRDRDARREMERRRHGWRGGPRR